MKKLFLLLTGFLLLILFNGCTSVKRYKSATWKEQDNTLVDMELFGTRLSHSGPEVMGRDLWELSASAQTQLIQILNQRYPDNGQFISSLSNRYLDDMTLQSLDFTGKNLRMVFTIKRLRDYSALNDASSRFSPADRIEYLRYSLEIPSDYHLNFKQWNRYSTEYGEIEIADVSFSQSLDLDADGKIKEAGVGGKTSFSRTEEQEVRRRYLKLNGSISERTIIIEEEGNREIDLTGNVIADVSLEFDGFPERLTIPLFSGGGDSGVGTEEVVSLSFMDVLVPGMTEAPDTISAILTLEYVYRHVQSGWKTFAEWDDKVEYYSGSIKRTVPLFTKKDYLPFFYCIGTVQDGNKRLKIRKGTGNQYLLQFKDYTDAKRFMEWLESVGEPLVNPSVDTSEDTSDDPVAIGNFMLLLSGEPLTPGQVGRNQFKLMPVF